MFSKSHSPLNHYFTTRLGQICLLMLRSLAPSVMLNHLRDLAKSGALLIQPTLISIKFNVGFKKKNESTTKKAMMRVGLEPTPLSWPGPEPGAITTRPPHQNHSYNNLRNIINNYNRRRVKAMILWADLSMLAEFFVSRYEHRAIPTGVSVQTAKGSTIPTQLQICLVGLDQ
jgi:hypothetical protein